MGQFSWISQNEDRAILENESGGEGVLVTMIDNKGNKWHETSYEGYGVFGGKDYYALVAEMNGVSDEENYPGDDNHNRHAGIDLNVDDPIYPNLVHGDGEGWVWVEDAPEDDPNQGWGDDDDDEDDECPHCGH